MFPVSPIILFVLLTILRSEEAEEESERACLDYSRDCERRANLCDSKPISRYSFHSDLMHRSCPKTCKIFTPSSALVRSYAPPDNDPPENGPPEQATVTKSRRPMKKCKDLAPDCEDTADLCDQSSFKKLMKKQCAKTCGFCSNGRVPPSSRSGGGAGGGGDSDVLTISGLAGTAEVIDLPKTKPQPATKGVKPKDIDGLSVSELVKLIRKAEETTDNSSSCADMAYDCPIKQGLCGNARYTKLMLKMCMRTCNRCSTSANGYTDDFVRADHAVKQGSYGGKTSDDQKVTKTPVIFIHGNSDAALRQRFGRNDMIGWENTIDYFQKKGYTSAELYATSWGDTNSACPSSRTHDCATTQRLRRFL